MHPIRIHRRRQTLSQAPSVVDAHLHLVAIIGGSVHTAQTLGGRQWDLTLDSAAVYTIWTAVHCNVRSCVG
jgi:hypothetical protein